MSLLDNIIDSTDADYINKTINKIKNNEIIKNPILTKEIKNIPVYEKGKGLPIGNMSSQFLAILYLNNLDHFIKNELHIKYYIRYMDDGVIIHRNKEYLKYCLEEIKKVLFIYKLELNNKTKIFSYKEGFEFLGFRYYVKNGKILIKVKNQTKKKFKRKIKSLKRLLIKEKISYKEYLQIESSYLGHLKYGNTKKLISDNTYKLKKIDIGERIMLENDNNII